MSGDYLTNDQRYFLEQGWIERVEGTYIPCDHCNRASVWWIPGKTSAWLCDEHWKSVVETRIDRLRLMWRDFQGARLKLYSAIDDMSNAMAKFAEAFQSIPLDDRIESLDEEDAKT